MEKVNKMEQASYLGGTATLVRQAVQQSSAWAQWQKTVLASVAQQQSREAQRLQAKYGNQDSSANEALQRAEILKARVDTSATQTQGLKRFLSTYTQPGLFHGYVLNTDGSAAQNAKVELSVGANEHKTFSASTQADGYFRLLLNGNRGTEKPVKESETNFAGLLKQMAQRQSQFDTQRDFRNLKKDGGTPASASASTPSAVAMEGVQVRVFDASGAERLNDENPPEFKDGESEFRVYVLPPVVGKV